MKLFYSERISSFWLMRRCAKRVNSKHAKKLSTNLLGLNSRCNPNHTVMFEVSWPAWTLDWACWDDRAGRHQGHLLPLTTSPLIIFIMQVKKWMETMCSLLWWWRGLFLFPYFFPLLSPWNYWRGLIYKHIRAHFLSLALFRREVWLCGLGMKTW